MNRQTQADAEQQRQGATIRVIRELRGLTLDQLANDLQISRPYLSNIEAGRKRMTPQLIAKAAEVLVVPQIALVRDGYFDREAAENEATRRRLEKEITNLRARLDQAIQDAHNLQTQLDTALAASKEVA